MLKPIIIIGLLLLCALTVSVYEVEHRVQELRKELKQTQHQIVHDKQEIHVLKAEWSYLNQPGRLRGMTKQFLEMEPVSANQVVAIEDIPLRGVVLAVGENEVGDGYLLSQR